MNRAILLIFAGVMPRVKEPDFDKDDLFVKLVNKTKYATEVEDINNDILTPKEYGLKRMKTKKYKL